MNIKRITTVELDADTIKEILLLHISDKLGLTANPEDVSFVCNMRGSDVFDRTPGYPVLDKAIITNFKS